MRTLVARPGPAGDGGRASLARRVGWPLLLVAVVVAVYAPGWNAPFLLDDHSSILDNSSIRQVWPPEAASIGGTRGRPLANLSFALTYAACGLSPWGYHATSVAIHAAGALLLFGLTRRLLAVAAPASLGPRTWEWAAGLTALLWAVHPLQTEAVAYAAQRTEILMGVCYLGVLYAFVRARQSRAHAFGWSAVAVVLGTAGMLSKEVMVTAPMAVLLCDRAFFAGSFSTALRTRRGFYAALAATWLPLAVLIRGIAERGVGGGLGVTPWSYAVTESAVLLRYAKLVLWPHPLVIDYGSTVPSLFAPDWPVALTVAGLAVAAFVVAVRHPRAGFVLFWPFLLLAPSSSVVPVALQPMAEHRLYLPLIAAAFGATWLIVQALRERAWVPLLALAVVFAGVAGVRCRAYQDPVRLWRGAVAANPANARGWENLGVAQLRAGDAAAAERSFGRALSLNPGSVTAGKNLLSLRAEAGTPAEALAFLETMGPNFGSSAEGRFCRGTLLLEMGRMAEARTEFEAALAQRPRYADALTNLATVLSQLGDDAGAVARLNAAIELRCDDSAIYLQRGDADVRLHRVSDAVNDYVSAVTLDPRSPAAERLTRLRGALERFGRGAR